MNRKESVKKLGEALKGNKELQEDLKINPIKVLNDFNVTLTDDELQNISSGRKINNLKGQNNSVLGWRDWLPIDVSIECEWE